MGNNEFITTHYYRIVVMGINNSMLYIMGSNEFITTHYHRVERRAGCTVWNTLLIVIPTKADFLGASGDK